MTISQIGSRYVLLSELGQGGMGIVYAAKDRLTDSQVALKRVLLEGANLAVSTHSNSTDVRLLLAQEFQTLATLRHPYIISVLDYGFDAEQQPFFTMNLLQDPLDIRLAAKQRALQGKIDLLIQLLHALVYLHRRDIIHRDLKPANVLVESNEQVRVVDFGLAGDHSPSEEMVGTLAYMAPEVIGGANAGAASDLYAVGVIAYEMLANRHPFSAPNSGELIRAILQDIPDLSPLPLPLQAVVGKLLYKDATQRYQDALEVINDLYRALGQPIPEESAALRDSFLQAAKFIGREVELAQLSGALSSAIAGRGGAWMIGGESGVGKSRLLNELSSYALVWGAAVLRGQAMETGGMPYQLLSDPLRRLLLKVEINDLEAGILKELLPDINTLLERPIPNAPELLANEQQQRLKYTMLEVFRRHADPILLILEDLHWASQESIDFVRQLAMLTPTRPILIIGSYRDDEMPAPPVPAARQLKLERLLAENVAELSTSMLGETGSAPELVELLHRESEGNVFFLIEIVRALAEEAGSLENIHQTPLRKHVVTGGVQTIVRRRLERVPAWGQDLLKIAAAAGRFLDLRLLAHCRPPEHPALETWLNTCASAAVLDVQDGQWRFAHDKLREALLATLDDQERPAIYRRVAQATEMLYPDNLNYAPVLAKYWNRVGDTQKEIHYLLIAGERELQINAYSTAEKAFKRALELLPKDDLRARLQILTRLGETYRQVGNFAESKYHLIEALGLAQMLGDTPAQAEVRFEMSQLLVLRGDFQRAFQYLAEALPLARQSENPRILGRVLYGLGDVNWRLQAEAADILPLLKESHAHAQKANDQAQIVYILNRLGTLDIDENKHDQGRQYFNQCIELARKIGNREREAVALLNIGAAAWYERDFAQARDFYQQAYRIFESYNKQDHSAAVTLYNLGLIEILLDEPQLAENYFRQALYTSDDLGSLAYSLPPIIGFAALRGYYGDLEGGLEWLGMATTHPSMQKTFLEDMEMVIEKVWAETPQAERDAIMERGKTLQLNTIIDQIRVMFPEPHG